MNIYGVIKISCPEGYGFVLKTNYAGDPEKVLEWGEKEYLTEKYKSPPTPPIYPTPDKGAIYRDAIHIGRDDIYVHGSVAADDEWQKVGGGRPAYFYRLAAPSGNYGKQLAGYFDEEGNQRLLHRDAHGRPYYSLSGVKLSTSE